MGVTFKYSVGDKVRINVAKPKWAKNGVYKEMRPELVGLTGVIVDQKAIKNSPRCIVYIPKAKETLVGVGEWQLAKKTFFKNLLKKT